MTDRSDPDEEGPAPDERRPPPDGDGDSPAAGEGSNLREESIDGVAPRDRGPTRSRRGDGADEVAGPGDGDGVGDPGSGEGVPGPGGGRRIRDPGDGEGSPGDGDGEGSPGPRDADATPGPGGGERIPGPGDGEGSPAGPDVLPPEEDDLHPALDLLADLGVYAVVGALGLALAGLAGIAAGVRPLGDAAVAVAIVVGSGSMVIGAVVGIASGQVSIRDRDDPREE